MGRSVGHATAICQREVRPPVVSGRVAAGSRALGEEGLAPAGSIFAAGVLAFAAAVPAVAFSPLGVDPEPIRRPPSGGLPVRRPEPRAGLGAW